MASPTQWTWVWASSRSWWRTGRPGVLQSMESQRVGHDLATEQQQKVHPHTPQRKSAPLRWWVSSVLFNFLDFARTQISVDPTSSEIGRILEPSYRQMHRLVSPQEVQVWYTSFPSGLEQMAGTVLKVERWCLWNDGFKIESHQRDLLKRALCLPIIEEKSRTERWD